MKKIEKYYESYWKRRLDTKDFALQPIRPGIPNILIRYTQYGSCLNLIPDGVKVLDIGCGEGNISEMFIKKTNTVFGFEISETAGILAKARKIKVVKGDLNTIPFPFKDNSFEIITIVDVLEHVINPINLLQEVKRILKINGKLIVQMPNFARLDNRLRMLLTGDPTDLLHKFSGRYGDGMEHLQWFTKHKVKEFLIQSGFLNIKFYPVGLPFGFFFGLIRCHNIAKLLLVDAKPDKSVRS